MDAVSSGFNEYIQHKLNNFVFEKKAGIPFKKSIMELGNKFGKRFDLAAALAAGIGTGIYGGTRLALPHVEESFASATRRMPEEIASSLKSGYLNPMMRGAAYTTAAMLGMYALKEMLQRFNQ